MGCFLGCFGSKNDRKRSHQRYKLIPRDQQRLVYQSVLQDTTFSQHVVREEPQSPVAALRVKPEEQLKLSNRKKVTFDSNVRTYDYISVNDSTESLLENKREEDVLSVARSQALSCTNSGNDSVNSSSASYPPNHRYQNCQESDDEVEDLEYEDSNFDDEDDDCEDEEVYGDDYEEGPNERIVCQKVWSQAESSFEASMEAVGTKRYARDRSEYVHPVLNPVENLSQWKAVKAKRTTPPSNPQKENFSFNLPTLKPQKSREIPVDSSLSNWLTSTKDTPTKKAIGGGLESIPSEKSLSQESISTSLWSVEDRPILGVLTVEELRQFSVTPSPRKSPCRSPEDMPIIGSVGSYWSHSSSGKDSETVSSYKGIPNTSSKYREIYAK